MPDVPSRSILRTVDSVVEGIIKVLQEAKKANQWIDLKEGLKHLAILGGKVMKFEEMLWRYGRENGNHKKTSCIFNELTVFNVQCP